MDRGQVGNLPRTTTLADESYLDFVEAFRVYSIEKMSPLVQVTGAEKLEQECSDADSQEMPITRLRDIFNELPVARTWQRVMRSHQEMIWRGSRRTCESIEDEHLKELQEAESKGPGKLVIDPNFHVPKYARREIHLQPGGYTDDPIGGLVHHYGTKVFYLGNNDQDQLHIDIANKACAPTDGRVKNVLDLGCSIGQATVALKDRFPDAEVWGLDVGLPMVRYAHKRANDLNSGANFIQALAEDTGFPDGNFDMVLAYILFHEVPTSIAQQIVKEVHRILRPGGLFTVYDFPNHVQEIPPGFRFIIDYDSRDNCEPYSPGFVKTNFRALLEKTGFAIEDGEQLSGPYGHFLQAIRAVRT